MPPHDQRLFLQARSNLTIAEAVVRRALMKQISGQLNFSERDPSALLVSFCMILVSMCLGEAKRVLTGLEGSGKSLSESLRLG
jgi:hypothetical protein